MLSEVVPAALDGERADRMVALVTGCTRSQAADLIAAGGLVRNQRPVKKGSERVTEGDEVTIDDSLLDVEVTIEADDTITVDVVHEDDHVIVVNKPAGIVVHPGAGTPEATLVNGLLARYPELAAVGEPERPGIVHRLDKGTSGLLMVARDRGRPDRVGRSTRHASRRTALHHRGVGARRERPGSDRCRDRAQQTPPHPDGRGPGRS